MSDYLGFNLGLEQMCVFSVHSAFIQRGQNAELCSLQMCKSALWHWARHLLSWKYGHSEWPQAVWVAVNLIQDASALSSLPPVLNFEFLNFKVLFLRH